MARPVSPEVFLDLEDGLTEELLTPWESTGSELDDQVGLHATGRKS
jgi:hypothetical protein